MRRINITIITGFLGVGKTTFIKNVLNLRPSNENWGVIVNEFGEVGVDALLLNDKNIQIKQVAGGCACCIAQLPFQIALNDLLKSKVMHRIFIEPSGLGHADSLMKILQQDQYTDWLNIGPTITVIDPVQFSQEKYRNHELYLRQLNAADLFYINKISSLNITQDSSFEVKESSVNDIIKYACLKAKPYKKEFGKFDDSVLNYIDGVMPIEIMNSLQGSQPTTLFTQVSSVKKDTFYQTHMHPEEWVIFDQKILLDRLKEMRFDRVKAVVNTDRGLISLNGVLHSIKVEPYSGELKHQLIEVISNKNISKESLFRILSEAIVEAS